MELNKLKELKMQISNENFEKFGYLILDGVIDEEYISALKKAVDTVISDQLTAFKNELLRSHIESHFNIEIADKLLGKSNYLFHHINAALHKEGNPSLCWHHDLENYTGSRDYKMIHIFYYLNGLTNSIGELLILPGSHKLNISRYEYASHPLDYFGDKIITINSLKSGSIIVINSALLHARRALPYIENTPNRYFIDCSYCEYGGKWAPFREAGNWKKNNNFIKSKSVELNGNKYDFLYDNDKFHVPLKDLIIDKLNIRKPINNLRNLFSVKVKKTFL